MPRRIEPRLIIREALLRYERWLGRSNDTEIARKAGLPRSTYGDFKSTAPQQSPQLRQLIALQHVLREPIAHFFDHAENPLLYRHEGIAWRIELKAAGRQEHAVRLAALGAALGESPGGIAARIRTAFGERGSEGRVLDADEIAHMARGGLALGMVVPELSETGVEIERAALSEELSGALSKITPGKITLSARVVANVAHADFGPDPVAPWLIARAAHELVRSFLAGKAGCTIGIAGGYHLDAFVRSAGPASSPFPASLRGRASYVLVPLTLEPLHDHRYTLADPLVGELFARGNALLGPRRLKAPSFLSFGHIREGDVAMSPDAVTFIRRHYADLDVAVFGCGDGSDAGWIQHAAVSLGSRPQPMQAVTDVCLNVLDANAQPIPLNVRGVESEYLGVALRHIEPVARNGLALLLTSGASKGLPLTLVVRAGCANAVICDEAAAKTALRVLA